MQQDAITMQHDANPSARPEQPPDSTSYINRVGIRVPAFPVREASRVVCAVGGTVRVIQHHTRLDIILLRHFAVGEQVRGGGGGRHNQPPTHKALRPDKNGAN